MPNINMREIFMGSVEGKKVISVHLCVIGNDSIEEKWEYAISHKEALKAFSHAMIRLHKEFIGIENEDDAMIDMSVIVRDLEEDEIDE